MWSLKGKHVTSVLCSALVLYPLTVAFLRFRRKKVHNELMEEVRDLQDDNPKKVEAARQINLSIATLEFPSLYRLSLEFALFKTYAIPSISKLLQKTKVFETVCGVRYDDTDLLLAEITQNPLDSTRSKTAMDRLNFIHAQYKTITNEDMVYVLGAFVLEPYRWIDKFEWRATTEAERQALYILWKDVGRRMGIQEIPSSLEEFSAWSEEYEKKHMVYAESNTVIGKATFDLFLAQVPTFLHGFGYQASYCLMDDRLRKAMGYPDPHPLLQSIIHGILAFRAGLLWWFFLPRPSFLSRRRSPFPADTRPKSGTLVPRYHIYECTYAKGYIIDRLGNAPGGKMFPSGTCPVYRGK